MSVDGYFGLCPHCHKTDGYINVGKSHWVLCDEHKVKWCCGSNLFSSWRQESEEQQREIYYRRGVDAYKEVQPFFPTPEELGLASTPGKSFPPEFGDVPF